MHYKHPCWRNSMSDTYYINHTDFLQKVVKFTNFQNLLGGFEIVKIDGKYELGFLSFATDLIDIIVVNAFKELFNIVGIKQYTDFLFYNNVFNASPSWQNSIVASNARLLEFISLGGFNIGSSVTIGGYFIYRTTNGLYGVGFVDATTEQNDVVMLDLMKIIGELDGIRTIGESVKAAGFQMDNIIWTQNRQQLDIIMEEVKN